MKKRIDEAAEPSAVVSSEKKQTDKQKYSVTAYIAMFVTAVLLVMILSYFIGQRNHSETINALNEKNTTAQLRIEELQDSNMEMQAKLEEYELSAEAMESTIERLENELASLEEQQRAYEKDYFELLERYQALKDKYETEENET